MSDLGLFADAEVESSSRVFVLTNRHNLLAMLGARLIGPRAMFSKYYPDLLETCPGRIPLLSMGFGRELLDLVSPKTDAFRCSSSWIRPGSQAVRSRHWEPTALRDCRSAATPRPGHRPG